MIKRCVFILLVLCLAAAGPVRAAFFTDSPPPTPARAFTNGLNESPILAATIPSWVFYSDQIGSEMGYAVATAGDVNGDGFADVILSAPKYDDGVYREGVVFAFHGGPGGLRTIPARIIASTQKGSYFGSSLASAGDINGDGYDDILIGAKNYNNLYSSEGAAFVYYGSPSGLSPTPAWSFYGGQKSAQLGASVSAAGDINRDGYADVVVGAPWYKDTYDREGAAFIFFGSESGLSTAPDVIFTGGKTNAQFGYSVAGAGDTNCGSYAGLIVGAPYYSNQPEAVGAVFLYTGSETGLVLTRTILGAGPFSGVLFGAAVSSAGDVNNDGCDDVLVGAPNYSGNHDREGAALVYLGSRDGLITTPVWMASGGQASSGFGAAVAPAGCVNDDPFPDILVGAYLYRDDQPAEGRVFLYAGGPSGPSTSPSWTADGNKAETKFAFSLGPAGDVNGDGFIDIIVGAPAYKSSNYTNGRAFVYYSTGSAGFESFLLFLPLLADF